MNALLDLVAGNVVATTVMAAAALLLGRYWKNSAAIHLMWVLVLLKLFVPPVVTAPLPTGWIDSFRWAATAEGEATARQNSVPDLSAAWGGAVASPHAADTLQPLGTGQPVERAPAPAGPGSLRGDSLSVLAFATWVLGSLLLIGRYAFLDRRFRRALESTAPPSDEIRGQVERIALRMGMKRPPEVRMTPQPLPPLVWRSGFRPIVLLPSRFFARLGGPAQQMVIAHELAHIERRDYLLRPLEVAARVVFWWHPVVWLACHQLHRHEEECCDRRAIEVTSGSSRRYAGVLVDTLEYLAEIPRVTAPLPTTAYFAGTLSRRIRMLSETRYSRLSRAALAAVLLVTVVPFVTAFAGEVVEPGQEESENAAADPAESAILKGRVVDQDKKPIEGARVLVAIPAARMRQLDLQEGVELVETTTNALGEYRLALPGVTQPMEVSTNVTKPGYRSSAGTLMRGGDFRRPRVAPGEELEHSYELEPSLYFKGTVVDEQGQPVPNVSVVANLSFSGGTGGVERAVSDNDGRFELFNYQEELAAMGEGSAGRVGFYHSDYVSADIKNAFALSAEAREQLRIVLPSGRTITGRVLSEAGDPVPRVAVKLRRRDGGTSKGILSDQYGRFRFAGVREGPVNLKVHHLALNEKKSVSLDLKGDVSGLEIRLAGIPLSSEPGTTEVLGMLLSNVNRELEKKYDLPPDLQGKGALILSPGANPERLKIGELSEGNLFWMVGEERIADLREFVEKLIAEANKQDGDEYSIRVVYTFSTLRFDGTNTQYLKLTKADIDQLRTVLRQLDEG